MEKRIRANAGPVGLKVNCVPVRIIIRANAGPVEDLRGLCTSRKGN